MAERLQKFLAKSGIGSRRYCEELIKSKKIKVNGQIALIGATVNRNDEVEYDGNIISFTESEIKLLMLNKPEGVLSSNKKEKNIPIVFDFLPEGKYIITDKLEDLNGNMTADTGDVVYTTEDQKPFDNYFGVNLYNVINEDTKKQIIVSEDNIERIRL